MAPDMFVTAAGVEGDSTGAQVSLAGHLPMLHFKRETQAIIEAHVLNFPLGFFPGPLVVRFTG